MSLVDLLMSITIQLSGDMISHNGNRVGCHGRMQSGRKVFVAFSDLFYSETAFTLSVGVLEKMEDDVRYIAFRDRNMDLTLFEARHFTQVLNGETDEDHYYLGSEQYNHDDKQVAVSAWECMKVYHHNKGEFNLEGDKYSEIKDI